ncbi:hypothetical protein L1887_44340 [Cichorium endivia]|nr:hypothetical protein L1887_44340 [Cichorium endivia]
MASRPLASCETDAQRGVLSQICRLADDSFGPYYCETLGACELCYRAERWIIPGQRTRYGGVRLEGTTRLDRPSSPVDRKQHFCTAVTLILLASHSPIFEQIRRCQAPKNESQAAPGLLLAYDRPPLRHPFHLRVLPILRIEPGGSFFRLW